MEENKGFSIPSKIILGLLALAVLAYTVFHVASLFQTEMTTIAAGKTTEYTTISASGYVFRDEKILYSENGGAVDYEVKDGEKVSIGQTLAYVYGGSDGESLRRHLRLIDAQIAVLEESTREAVKHMDISEANKQVGNSYASLVKMLASGEIGGLNEEIDSLLIGLNQAQMISSDGDAQAQKTLDKLYEARNNILSGSSAKLHTSERGGYFYSVVDGYENAFTMAAAKSLDPDRFYSLLLERNGNTSPDGQRAYGKLAFNSEWNFVIPLSSAEAVYFTEGETYDISFLRSNGLSLPMTLEQLLVSEDRGDVFARFSCDRLPDGFLFNRSEDVGITVDSVSGMYVPEEAVERVDGRVGVYILRGSVVQFRCIEIVYEGNGYYLVREDASDEEENVAYLRPNDLIILNGYQLFDGRIMD